MVDKITPEGLPALGVIETKTTSFGGHPPEFWAERLTEKLVGTSEDLEPHIEAQAKAYQDQIKKVCLKTYLVVATVYNLIVMQKLMKCLLLWIHQSLNK